MHSHDKIIDDLEKLAVWMDSKFILPGTKIRMGLDSILGWVPGVGDTATLAVSAYMLTQAKKLDVPPLLMARMVWNIFIDWLVGLVPLIGDIFDVGIKSNLKNVALMKEHVARNKL